MDLDGFVLFCFSENVAKGIRHVYRNTSEVMETRRQCSIKWSLCRSEAGVERSTKGTPEWGTERLWRTDVEKKIVYCYTIEVFQNTNCTWHQLIPILQVFPWKWEWRHRHARIRNTYVFDNVTTEHVTNERIMKYFFDFELTDLTELLCLIDISLVQWVEVRRYVQCEQVYLNSTLFRCVMRCSSS